MADLTDEELGFILRDGDGTAGQIRDLVHEVKRRRRQAETDLRCHVNNVALIGSLQRRLTELRGVLRRESWGNILQADDARRRRFEKKQRGRRG